MLAPLIGLGGWSIGLLLMLTLWPSVAPAYEPMSVLSIATPIALAVYFAWVHRTWPRSITRAGLSAAVGGAVVGAWLGLHAVSGLYGALTAVLGAVLASNLAVVVRVVLGTPPVSAGSRQHRDPVRLARGHG